jgi:dipeptidyl-peptidase-4
MKRMNKTLLAILPISMLGLALSTAVEAQVMLPPSTLAKGKIPAHVVEPLPTPLRFVDEDHVIMLDGTTGEARLYTIENQSSQAYTSKGKLSYEPDVHFSPDAAGVERYDGTIENAVNPYYSPDHSMVAFTRDNDLYVKDLNSGTEKRLTLDGTDLIKNGYSSWVYNEEIIGRPTGYKAFWWSPDSRFIAFLHTDDSKAPAFMTYDARGHFGTWIEWRYPTPGDHNPDVKLGVVSLENAFVAGSNPSIAWAQLDETQDHYLGTPFWSPDSRRLMATWMNRDQNHLEILSVAPVDGRTELVYAEDQKTWIDWPEGLAFNDRGFYVIRDFSLYEQVYFVPFNAQGYKEKYVQITDGPNWGIKLVKFDAKYLYYTARRDFSTVNQLYRVNLGGNERKTEDLSLTDYDYKNVIVSPKGTKYVAVYSNLKTPSKVIAVEAKKDGDSWLLADSRGSKFYDYSVACGEIVHYSTSDGLRLPAKVVWPVNIDKTKKYPVIVEIYGGPGYTEVMNTWTAPSFSNQWWAENGVIQIWIDNRASGHLGKRGLNQIYRQLGKYELRDFCDAVKWFERTYPFIDAGKIGVEGYSYGGMMTVLAVTRGNDVFKYGIAGSGVYNWTLYDSHYTERYMDTPQDNPDGYDKWSVVNDLGNYYGDDSNMLFLSHGTLDDNVHFQNTLQLVRKLQEQGRKFQLMIYPEGFHGYRGDQRKFWDRDNMTFWYKYLLGRELPSELDY